MAAAAAVAAAGRAVRYGVLSKALPTRLHINSGRGLDISEAEGPLDRYIQVLMVRTPLYRKPATLYSYTSFFTFDPVYLKRKGIKKKFCSKLSLWIVKSRFPATPDLAGFQLSK